jgi:hypothetical protein
VYVLVICAAAGEADVIFGTLRVESRECKEIGIEPSDEMALVLERFKVVYKPSAGN